MRQYYKFIHDDMPIKILVMEKKTFPQLRNLINLNL